MDHRVLFLKRALLRAHVGVTGQAAGETRYLIFQKVETTLAFVFLNYLQKGDIEFMTVFLFVCLCVCSQEYTNTTG